MNLLLFQAYPRETQPLVSAAAKPARDRVLPRVLAMMIGAALLLCLPTSAGAAASDNRANLALLPQAAKRLDVKSVRVISTGLARGRGNAIRLPVTGGQVRARNAQMRLGGGFQIKARGQGRKARSLRIGRLQLRLGKRSVMTARLGRDRVIRPAFILRHGPKALRLQPAGKTAKLANARLVPTAAMKRALRRYLGIKPVRSLPLARLALSADLTAFDLPEITPPPLAPLPPEPEKLARPASAVDVSAGQITWCARASWVRYIGNGAVSGGASHEEPFVVNDPADPRICDPQMKNRQVTSAPTAYRYFFTFKEGWYDAASQQAALYYTGKVRFRYPERGIDLEFDNPEVEISGASTRTIFTVEGHGNSPIQAHRTVVFTNGSPVPGLSESSPGSFTSGDMLSFLSPDAQTGVFAGFYMPPNHDFGWISVGFTAAP